MTFDPQSWGKEYEHLHKSMNEEGMSCNIGMPFTLMMLLLDSANNYMKENIKDKKEFRTHNKRYKGTQEYYDWKRMHDKE